MNFFQARTLCEKEWWIRRESWAADKWIIFYEGVWWCSTGGAPHVVKATDYGKEDLLAVDWTNVPKELADCPIDPDTGSTGGDPPAPGGGAPSSGDNDDASGEWSNGGGGAPGSHTGPPSPPPGTIRVAFAGMEAVGEDFSPDPAGFQRLIGTPNRSYYVKKVSADFWESDHSMGNYTDNGGSVPAVATISVTRTGDGADARFSIHMGINFWAGGFAMGAGVLRGEAAVNIIPIGGGDPGPRTISGGTAAVY